MESNSTAQAAHPELQAFIASVESVIGKEAPRAAVQAYAEQGSDLAKDLWAQAVELGWPWIVDRSSGGDEPQTAALGLAMLHIELGKGLIPGPYLANLALAAALGSEDFQEIAENDPGVAIPAQVIGAKNPSGSGAWAIGTAQARLGLVADGERWKLTRFASSPYKSARMWDATRDCCKVDGDQPGETVRILTEEEARQFLCYFALSVAADCVGGARQILEQTIEYLKTRQQFGRAIGSFQAIKHRVANMEKALRLQEELVAHAAEVIDAGASGAEFWALMAKADASDMYVATAADCLQLFGGIGFTRELDCHLFVRRARLNQVLVGPNQAIRDRAAELYAEAAINGSTLMELAL